MNNQQEYIHLLSKSLDAKRGGHDAWRVQSTGEKVAVAIVLNKPKWLAEMNYTLAEAFDRAGSAWWPLLIIVERELQKDWPQEPNDKA
jgi:hypothetical protein